MDQKRNCVKVSNLDGKSVFVIADNYEQCVEKASRKLNLNVKIFVRKSDRAQIDEDDVYQAVVVANNEDGNIHLIALEDGDEISQESLNYQNYVPEYWKYANLTKALRENESVDVCFLIDCTKSMEMQQNIDKIKDLLSESTNHLKQNFKNLKFRVGFVGYRDFKDTEQFLVLKFTKNIDEFREFVAKIRAKGGDDEAEDVLGGLLKVTELKWENKTRMLIHICDAPCHGRQFHTDEVEDDYPDEDPRGYKASKILKTLSKLEITYYFLKMTDYTDKMIDEFTRILDPLGSKISTFLLPSADQLLGTFLTGVTLSITEAQNLTKTNKIHKTKKNIPLQRFIDWNVRNKAFEKHNAKCYTFKFKGNMSTFKKSESDSQPDERKQKIDKCIKVEEKETDVWICKTPFAKGGLRYAYPAILETSKGRIKCVAKNSLYEDDGSQEYAYNRTAIKTQLIAKYLGKKFLTPGNKTLSFIQIKLIYIEKTQEFFTIEKYIDEPFLKWNNNIGIVNEDIYANTLDTFSHWTYVATDNYLVISDLQGFKIDGAHRYILTDPSISCIERQFSSTDLGDLGIVMFFEKHKCNHLCRVLSLKKPIYQKEPDRNEPKTKNENDTQITLINTETLKKFKADKNNDTENESEDELEI